MANKFYYRLNSEPDNPNKSYDQVSLSALCEFSMVNKYGTSLNAQGYQPDETYLVKYNSSLLNGLWANKRAEYSSDYLVEGSQMNIAARGCAPVPNRTDNIPHIDVLDQSESFRLLYLKADSAYAKSGKGIYIAPITALLTAENCRFMIDRTHLVIDIVAGGGGGSGGSTGANAAGSNLSGRSCGGSGGGAGAWASYLIDLTKHGDFIIELGTAGAGGACQSSGGTGGDSFLAIVTNSYLARTEIDTLAGGKGAVGSTKDGVGNAGTGGQVTKGTLSDSQLASYGVYRLASGAGANGGKGATVDGNHASGTQGSSGPQSIAFGSIASFPNKTCSGGSAELNSSITYSNIDKRCGLGGGGGGSIFEPGGHAAYVRSISTTTGEAGLRGSGGGGGAGGRDITCAGGAGGYGYARLYFENEKQS